MLIDKMIIKIVEYTFKNLINTYVLATYTVGRCQKW